MNSLNPRTNPANEQRHRISKSSWDSILSVRATHLQRRAVLLGACDDDGQGAVDAVEDQGARLADLEGQGRAT